MAVKFFALVVVVSAFLFAGSNAFGGKFGSGLWGGQGLGGSNPCCPQRQCGPVLLPPPPPTCPPVVAMVQCQPINPCRQQPRLPLFNKGDMIAAVSRKLAAKVQMVTAAKNLIMAKKQLAGSLIQKKLAKIPRPQLNNCCPATCVQPTCVQTVTCDPCAGRQLPPYMPPHYPGQPIAPHGEPLMPPMLPASATDGAYGASAAAGGTTTNN